MLVSTNMNFDCLDSILVYCDNITQHFLSVTCKYFIPTKCKTSAWDDAIKQDNINMVKYIGYMPNQQDHYVAALNNSINTLKYFHTFPILWYGNIIIVAINSTCTLDVIKLIHKDIVLKYKVSDNIDLRARYIHMYHHACYRAVMTDRLDILEFLWYNDYYFDCDELRNIATEEVLEFIDFVQYE